MAQQNKIEPTEIRLTGSVKMNLIYSLLSLFGSVVVFIRYFTGDGTDPMEHWAVGVILGVVSLYLFKFVIRPKPKLLFRKEGIWMEEQGHVNWTEIESIKIETRAGYKGIKDRALIILQKGQITERVFRFTDLSVNESQFVPLFSAFKQVHNIEL